MIVTNPPLSWRVRRAISRKLRRKADRLIDKARKFERDPVPDHVPPLTFEMYFYDDLVLTLPCKEVEDRMGPYVSTEQYTDRYVSFNRWILRDATGKQVEEGYDRMSISDGSTAEIRWGGQCG